MLAESFVVCRNTLSLGNNHFLALSRNPKSTWSHPNENKTECKSFLYQPMYKIRKNPLVFPVIAAGIFHVIIIILYLIPFHCDLGIMLLVPPDKLGQGPYQDIHVTRDHGFDGAFYFAISQNPFHPDDKALDSPCYRRARIFYPLVSWFLSWGGNAHLLLWIMPLLNLMATLGIVWIGGTLARHHHRSTWWGALLPMAVFTIIPSMRNLTDPWSALAVLAVIASSMLNWSAWSTLLWALVAVFTREQNIAIVGAVALRAILDREWRRVGAVFIACACSLAWLITLWLIYGHPPRASDTLDAPFTGIAHLWKSVPSLSTKEILTVVFVFTIQLICCLRISFQSPQLVGLVASIAFGLASCAGQALFTTHDNFLRVLNWVPLALWLWSISSNRRWPALLLIPAILYPLFEVRFVQNMGIFIPTM